MKSSNPIHYILFLGALLTAGMTAFYMFRMVILTFFGTPRDHHKFDHAHESPLNMTIPLDHPGDALLRHLVRALVREAGREAEDRGQCRDGFRRAGAGASKRSRNGGGARRRPGQGRACRGSRGARGGAAAAHGESHDAEHDAHIAHVAHRNAMYSSVVTAGLGILLAFGIYMLGWVDPNAMAERFKPLYLFSLNKWYFDELYEATVINGSKAFSRGCAWFDNNVVDGLVNLSAQVGVFLAMLIGKFDNARGRRRRERRRRRYDRKRFGTSAGANRKAVPLPVHPGWRRTHYFPGQVFLGTEEVLRGFHR